ncbi:MFS transporter [Janthinobacterium agaricidamnosum]|uniref:Major Facilitator Superfamily protein n=1 Tax=Janthinobacterium agaricidamnosum NBRC 102515 = DSM 9628 TaxID=1349767 RepID=W0UXK6_9BURK|nr:MFS transporter [Janthinobacterium agaricidamnosum]CDG81284.1 major Facilitator Superfamily protein [Janthinobacterium agaricidamnosum NBRC 102515 = DSM 9628]
MGDEKPAAPAEQLSGAAVFFLVFLPFALGHFFSSLMRTVNAVLMSDLLAAMPLTPSELGLLTSAFFFAFALAQLPIGIALDRYGPRTVQLLLMGVAALGVWMFSRGQNFTDLLCARAVMGLGLGGCFMSAVKAISTWIAPSKLPSVHGYLIAVGGLGAASATLPVKMALEFTDWRGVFYMLAGGIAIIGLLIFLLTPKAASTVRKPASRSSVLDVYRDPAFRDTVSLILIPHTIFFGVQGLWIGKWLNDVAGFSGDAVAYLLYLSMAAIIFGAIGVGMLTEWLGRRGIQPVNVAAGGIVIFIAVQIAFVINHAPSFQLLSVLFTLVGTITGLEYAIVAQSMPPALTGRASTCLNLLIFSGAFVVQAGFGMILGFWHVNAHQQYPAVAYQAAFGVLVLLQLPGLIWFFIRQYQRGRMAERRQAVASGKMEVTAIINSKEEYETGSLRPSRQRKTGPDR